MFPLVVHCSPLPSTLTLSFFLFLFVRTPSSVARGWMPFHSPSFHCKVGWLSYTSFRPSNPTPLLACPLLPFRTHPTPGFHWIRAPHVQSMLGTSSPVHSMGSVGIHPPFHPSGLERKCWDRSEGIHNRHRRFSSPCRFPPHETFT